MTETSTPGPWRWRSAHGHCFLESARPPEECSCHDVTVLAVREDWVNVYADTSKARYRRQFDRNLIAAAPETFAMLKALVKKIDRASGSPSFTSSEHDKLLSFIEKVEGKE
jgi:hypothetical protein